MSRKTYQIEILPHPQGAVIFHRLDNGSVFYTVLDLQPRSSLGHAPPPPDWIEVPPPPGVRPFTGSNGASEAEDEASAPWRRRY